MKSLLTLNQIAFYALFFYAVLRLTTELRNAMAKMLRLVNTKISAVVDECERSLIEFFAPVNSLIMNNKVQIRCK